MIKIIVILNFILWCNSYGFSQNIEIQTSHTYVENGSVGEESYKFNFQNGWLYKTDLDLNRTEKYPSYYEEGSYDPDGNYGALYSAKKLRDINALEFLKYKNDHRAYKVVFTKKGGEILYVMELKSRKGGQGPQLKYYLTQLGKRSFNNL